MIEIQCTSCHTRYRIDERVLPPESPTFKCSRCGHVFTSDPIGVRKDAVGASLKPYLPRTSTPHAEAKPEGTPSEDAPPKAAAEPSRVAAAPQQRTVSAKPQSPEAKSAPMPKYVRNPRPTVFDRKPEPPPPKPSAQPSPPPSQAASSLPSEGLRNAKAFEGSENLEFDFNEEPAPELGADPVDQDVNAAPANWSVGDERLDAPRARASGFSRGEPDPAFSRGAPAPIGRGTIPQHAGGPAIRQAALPDERAYIERAQLHGARTFIGLFFAVALVFVALTLVIYGIPSASAELLRKMPVIGPEFVQPTPLENLVGVSDVQSSYQAIKGKHTGLVLTGAVKNNSTVPLHLVQIGVRLLDASQHEVARSAAYCGTTLSPRMIGEMTPHELDFLQKLDPPKNFVLEPGHAAPFLMVFIDPPSELEHVAVAVTRAEPPDGLEIGAQASTEQ